MPGRWTAAKAGDAKGAPVDRPWRAGAGSHRGEESERSSVRVAVAGGSELPAGGAMQQIISLVHTQAVYCEYEKLVLLTNTSWQVINMEYRKESDSLRAKKIQLNRNGPGPPLRPGSPQGRIPTRRSTSVGQRQWPTTTSQWHHGHHCPLRRAATRAAGQAKAAGDGLHRRRRQQGRGWPPQRKGCGSAAEPGPSPPPPPGPSAHSVPPGWTTGASLHPGVPLPSLVRSPAP